LILRLALAALSRLALYFALGLPSRDHQFRVNELSFEQSLIERVLLVPSET